MVAGATEIWDSAPDSLSFAGTYTIGANALCAPLQSVVSRKIHGGAGTFDIPLPLTGTPGLESRGTSTTSNSYTLIYTLGGVPSTAGSATVTHGTASGVSTAAGPGANQVTVTLTGVATGQHLTISLGNVQIVNGGTLNNLAVPMDVLVGDVNQSRHVDAGDVGAVQRQNSQPVTSSNFRMDVNASGHIDAGDVGLVQRANSTGLQ